MASMGIGCCMCGYANETINKEVKSAIYEGSMSSLNCFEELILAEKLLEMHSFEGMVRYAKTGGEAMTIAVRIARAFTNKDIIAFTGYHGWHDWYLSANLENSTNLNVHLLPDLKVGGVPKCLKGTTIPFEFNNIEQLKEIIDKNDVGVIIIEPMRHEYPKNNFLENVQKIAKKIGAVVIYDCITIGFREIVPELADIYVYAKAISNGYPMAAIVGKRKIMESCENTFISSTYWTERIGLVAAIATLRFMKENNVMNYVWHRGNDIGFGWMHLATQFDLDVTILPPNSLITLKFNYKNAKELEDLFKIEMLKRGYIAGLGVYSSFAHTKEIINTYLENVKEVFKTLKEVAKK